MINNIVLVPDPNTINTVWFAVVFNTLRYKLIALKTIKYEDLILPTNHVDRMFFVIDSEFELIIDYPE